MESRNQRKRTGRPPKQQSNIASNYSSGDCYAQTSPTNHDKSVSSNKSEEDSTIENPLCHDTDNSSSNSPLPTSNVAECRRSSRKKFIKFDVRDLLNKNRKSHKIQIEARIDSNVTQPKIASTDNDTSASVVENSNVNLSNKQKTFIEKSAIFRRYSISEQQNKINASLRPPVNSGVLPPPLNPKNSSFMQNSATDLVDIVASKDQIQARRLSRTQEFFNASMMKSKQISSLIVTQMESYSSSTNEQSSGRHKTPIAAQTIAAGNSYSQKLLKTAETRLVTTTEPLQRRGRGRPKKNKQIVEKSSVKEVSTSKKITKNLNPTTSTCDVEIISIDSNSNDTLFAADMEAKSNESTLSLLHSDDDDLEETEVRRKMKSESIESSNSSSAHHTATLSTIESQSLINEPFAQYRGFKSKNLPNSSQTFTTSCSSSSRTSPPQKSSNRSEKGKLNEKMETSLNSFDDCQTFTSSKASEDSAESFPSEMIVAAVEEVATEVIILDDDYNKPNKTNQNVETLLPSENYVETKRSRISSSGSSSGTEIIGDSPSQTKSILSNAELDVERRKLRVSLKRMLFSKSKLQGKLMQENEEEEEEEDHSLNVSSNSSDDTEKSVKYSSSDNQEETQSNCKLLNSRKKRKRVQKQNLRNNFEVSCLVQESYDPNLEQSFDIINVYEEDNDESSVVANSSKDIESNVSETSGKDDNIIIEIDELTQEKPETETEADFQIQETQAEQIMMENEIDETNHSLCELIEIEDSSECFESTNHSIPNEISVPEQKSDIVTVPDTSPDPPSDLQTSKNSIENDETSQITNNSLHSSTVNVIEIEMLSLPKVKHRTTEELKKLPPKKQLQKLILSKTEDNYEENQLKLPPKKQLRRLLSVQSFIPNFDIDAKNAQQEPDAIEVVAEESHVVVENINEITNKMSTESEDQPQISSESANDNIVEVINEKCISLDDDKVKAKSSHVDDKNEESQKNVEFNEIENNGNRIEDDSSIKELTFTPIDEISNKTASQVSVIEDEEINNVVFETECESQTVDLSEQSKNELNTTSNSDIEKPKINYSTDVSAPNEDQSNPAATSVCGDSEKPGEIEKVSNNLKCEEILADAKQISETKEEQIIHESLPVCSEIDKSKTFDLIEKSLDSENKSSDLVANSESPLNYISTSTGNDIASSKVSNCEEIKCDEKKISMKKENSIKTPSRRGRKPKSLKATNTPNQKDVKEDSMADGKFDLKSDVKVLKDDYSPEGELCENLFRTKGPPKKRLFKSKSDLTEKKNTCDNNESKFSIENNKLSKSDENLRKKSKKREVILMKPTKASLKQMPDGFLEQCDSTILLTSGGKIIKNKKLKEKKSKSKDEKSMKGNSKKCSKSSIVNEENSLREKSNERKCGDRGSGSAKDKSHRKKKKSIGDSDEQRKIEEKLSKSLKKNQENSNTSKACEMVAVSSLSLTPPLVERDEVHNDFVEQVNSKDNDDISHKNSSSPTENIDSVPSNEFKLQEQTIKSEIKISSSSSSSLSSPSEQQQPQSLTSPSRPEPEEDSDPLKDIEKFIEDGVNLLKRGYKLDEEHICVSGVPAEVLQTPDQPTTITDIDLVAKKTRFSDENETTTTTTKIMTNEDSKVECPFTTISLNNISFAETPAATPITTPSTTPPPPPSKSPPLIDPDDSNSMTNFIRRSDRIKIISQSSKSLVGRGVVRDKERFSLKEDQETKSHYTLDDQKLDLAEVEAKNAKFLKDMEECLSNFRVIKENEYKCERIISREAKKMICDCFLTTDEEERGELGCGEDCLNRLLMIECGADCNVKERCTNRRFQKFLCSPCRIFRTEKKGFGIMADVEILPGEFIMEYVGEVIDGDEFELRRTVYSQDKNKHYYFMALRSDSVIDATNKGNISRFINHSCDPNAETQKWTVNGELRIGFFSRKSIMPGEEITFDYQYQRYGREAQRCFCDSSNCRGWIGDEPNLDDGADNNDNLLEEDDEDDDDDDDESDDSDTDEKEVQKKLEMAAAAAKVLPIEMENKDTTEILGREQVNDAFLAAISAASIKHEAKRSTAEKKFKKLLNKMAARKQKKTKLIGDYSIDRIGGAVSATSKSKSLRYLEDPDIDDAVRFLLNCGLKNQSDTLHLSRLMVRAKLIQTRLKLLEVLRKGELPCRRLFLDYHGLRLLHGWMSEAVHENDINLRMALLETLESLPISNKTMLVDSKVLQTVRSWGGISDNSSPSDDSSKESTINPVQDTSTTELQKLAIKLSNNWENLAEVFRIPKRERIEQMKEHEREADRQYNALTAADEDDNISMARTGDRSRNRFGRSTINSSTTSTSYRYKWAREKEKEPRERNIIVLGSSADRRNDKSVIQSMMAGGNSMTNAANSASNNLVGNLSKEQRREMFAAKVARDEAEKRVSEERKEFETKCRFFGLDPKKLSQKEMPFCVNPATGQWYTFDRQPIPTPPSYAHVQVPVKPKSTNPIDYQLPDKMDLPPLWKFAISPQGKLYYYHVKIRIPQWEPPIKILPLSTGSGANGAGRSSNSESCDQQSSANASDSDSETAKNDSTDEDEDVIKSLDPVKLQAYVEKKVEFRRLQRYNRLVGERSISPRREEDRIYNQMEVRKYKENKEKIRKRKEEIRKRRATILKVGNNSPSSLANTVDCGKKESDMNLTDAVPIQDYLLSSDEEEIIKAECNNSPLIDKIVQGDKIVDELDALTIRRPLKRPIKLLSTNTNSNEEAISTSASGTNTNISNADGNDTASGNLTTCNEKYEHKKRKLEKSRSSKSKEKEMSTKYRKIKEKFRSEIAGLIVQNLKPYRKDSCLVGRIQNDSDFSHLARKLTHFVMIKELKYCESVGQTLVVTESVKNKSREFIKKYMAKYGDVYLRPKNDPEFREIPLQL